MSRYTEAQKANIIELYTKQGMSVNWIARKCGHGKNCVHRVLRESGTIRVKERLGTAIGKSVAEDYEKGSSITELCKKYDCCRPTIRRALSKHGVQVRRRGNRLREMTDEERSLIVHAWRSGVARGAILKMLGGIGHTTLNRWMVQLGEFPENRGLKGDKHPHWKGGRHTTEHGYVMKHVPRDSTFACMSNAMGYVPEHRLVMAEWLGRPLLPTERIHHRNGDRKDNRIENLQLLLGNHSQGQAYCCAECGSRNLTPIDLDKADN